MFLFSYDDPKFFCVIFKDSKLLKNDESYATGRKENY
jgi:hypothetical protein